MLRTAPLALLTGLALASTVMAQTPSTVYFHDRTAKTDKVSDFSGTITEETVNGVKVKPQVGPERTFPVIDIVDVAYGPPTALQIPFNPIKDAEGVLRTGAGDLKTKMTQLVKEYTAFLPKITDPKAVSLKRHVQYRLAVLKAALAEKREDQLTAIADLDKVRKEVSGSWQLIPTVRQEVQLMADTDKLDEAARVLDDTARTPNLAKELKQELELTLIDTMIRAGKASEVESRINEALQTLPPNDPLAARLKVYQLGCQAGKADAEKLAAQLKGLIEASPDAGLKALGYNTLGDCYSAKGLKKDAMWAYLWVDVVYNQDKAEYAKAVERLSRVFKDLNDDARAEKYKEKLKSLR